MSCARKTSIRPLVLARILVELLQACSARLPKRHAGVCLSARIAAGLSLPGVDQILVRGAPRMPLRPAKTLPMCLRCWRAVSMTPAALALMTAVTPPDWA
jgi:hypothetical protein